VSLNRCALHQKPSLATGAVIMMVSELNAKDFVAYWSLFLAATLWINGWRNMKDSLVSVT
jgi:hypothetical protein